jgi:hypothetical protein
MAILAPGGTLYLSWRVTADVDQRDAHGRLYGAFDADLVRGQSAGAVLLDEEVVSASSAKEPLPWSTRNWSLPPRSETLIRLNVLRSNVNSATPSSPKSTCRLPGAPASSRSGRPVHTVPVLQPHRIWRLERRGVRREHD